MQDNAGHPIIDNLKLVDKNIPISSKQSNASFQIGSYEISLLLETERFGCNCHALLNLQCLQNQRILISCSNNWQSTWYLDFASTGKISPGNSSL